MPRAEKTFVDTNILLYAIDRHDHAKQMKARRLIESLSGEGTGVISTQVIQEFYVGATRKLGVDPLQAKDMLIALAGMEIVVVDMDLIHNAVDCSILNKLSFWDALIITSAEKASCRQLWTEDLNDGQTVRGVRIVNPFR